MNQKFVSKEDLMTLVDVQAAIHAMRQCFLDLESGTAVNYPRIVTELDPQTKFGVMPAYSGSRQMFASKNLLVSSKFRDLGHSSHCGQVVLSDFVTGDVKLVLDAGAVTTLRTAAVSALATSFLSSKKAKVLAVYGAGHLAFEQVRFLMGVRDFKTLLVFNRTRDNSEKLKSRMDECFRSRLETVICSNPKEMLHQADVVNFLTSAREPVVKSTDVREGAHINAIGACRPNECEVDFSDDLRLRIFYEDRDALLKESYEVYQPLQDGTLKSSQLIASLGQLASSRSGNQSRDQGDYDASTVSVFKGIGIGVEDLYFALYIFDILKAKVLK